MEVPAQVHSLQLHHQTEEMAQRPGPSTEIRTEAEVQKIWQLRLDGCIYGGSTYA